MIVAAGLLIAFVIIVLFSNRETRGCRWREYRQDGESRWTCVQCGAEVRGPIGQPPKVCHKGSSGTPGADGRA